MFKGMRCKTKMKMGMYEMMTKLGCKVMRCKVMRCKVMRCKVMTCKVTAYMVVMG